VVAVSFVLYAAIVLSIAWRRLARQSR
jgi:hypothetical protein